MNAPKWKINALRTLPIFLVILLSLSCSQTEDEANKNPTHLVTRNTISSTIETTGIIVTSSDAMNAQLTFGVNGVLGNIQITERAEVKKGQILAELDSKTIRNLETKVILARIALRDAQKGFEGAVVGYDTNNPEKTLTGAPLQEFRQLQAIVRNSSLALDNAVRDSKITTITWETKLESSQDQYELAFKEYNQVFYTWLGINLEEGKETSTDPGTLLSSLEIDLDSLFNPQGRTYNLPQYTNRTSLLDDDPKTRWDEGTVYVWNNFYPGVIKVSCEDDTPGFGELCILAELNTTWDLFHSIDQSLTSETLSANKATATAKNQVANAEKTLTDAQRNLSQFMNNPILDMEFQTAQLESAENNLDESETDLDNARLTAPFTGRILHIYVSEDDTVGANDAILRLVDPTDMEVQASIESKFIQDIISGQTAEIILDRYPDEILTAQIKEIGELADQSLGSNTVPLSLRIVGPTNLTLREGLTGRVRIVIGRAYNVLSIPKGYLKRTDPTNNSGIITVAFSDGTTQDISVQLGITDGILVEIQEGLNEGDEILVSPPN